MKNEAITGLMKIGGLAKAAGINVSTVKFYVKEGLIQAAVKTGPNMSYYHPNCVARIQLIRSLQKDHYYPLNVIKHMLETSGPNPMEVDLMDAIHKVDYKSVSKTFSLGSILHMTHLTKKQVELLVEKKLIEPEIMGKKWLFNETNLQVMLLISRRVDVGIPFSQSVETFAVYANALTDAVHADVDSFITKALLTQNLETEDIVRLIGVSDETLDKFISLRRSELNRCFGSARVSDLDGFSSRLRLWLQTLIGAFEKLGFPELAQHCTETDFEGDDPLSAALRFYHLLISSTSESLSQSMAVSGQAHLFFRQPDTTMPAGGNALLFYCLRLGWLYLAPSLLDYGDLSKSIPDGLRAALINNVGEAAAEFTPQLTSALFQIGGKNE